MGSVFMAMSTATDVLVLETTYHSHPQLFFFHLSHVGLLEMPRSNPHILVIPNIYEAKEICMIVWSNKSICDRQISILY